jgi:integrase
MDGKQTSTSFNLHREARIFCDLVDTHGPHWAVKAYEPERQAPLTPTLTEWLNHHIDHLTGVEQYTVDKYREYVRNDIQDSIGKIRLASLTEDDISRWVKQLETTPRKKTGKPLSPKTIGHLHGFVSGALKKAIPQHIPTNPAAGRRLPKRADERDLDDRLLSHDEFNRLWQATTEPWRPLVEFLVASGCRWGEATALKPEDVNRKTGVVRIRRAWKHGSTGYYIGPPKTKRSRRSINLPMSILDKLDYSHTWLFVNREGGPVRYPGFRRRVWDPAVKRAELDPKPTPHDLRHTCGSWLLMAGVTITGVSRHLGHESITVTVDTYGHLDRTVAIAAADVMGELLSPMKELPQ